jgi:hypothetical protein
MISRYLSMDMLCFCLLLGGIVCSSCSCRKVLPRAHDALSPSDSQVAEAPRVQVTQWMSKIHQGMTFDEVSRIVPISERNLGLMTHGGAQFEVVVGDYAIWLRFDRPKVPPRQLPTREDLRDCRLNAAPELLHAGRAAGSNGM